MLSQMHVMSTSAHFAFSCGMTSACMQAMNDLCLPRWFQPEMLSLCNLLQRRQCRPKAASGISGLAGRRLQQTTQLPEPPTPSKFGPLPGPKIVIEPKPVPWGSSANSTNVPDFSQCGIDHTKQTVPQEIIYAVLPEASCVCRRAALQT